MSAHLGRDMDFFLSNESLHEIVHSLSKELGKDVGEVANIVIEKLNIPGAISNDSGINFSVSDLIRNVVLSEVINSTGGTKTTPEEQSERIH